MNRRDFFKAAVGVFPAILVAPALAKAPLGYARGGLFRAIPAGRIASETIISSERMPRSLETLSYTIDASAIRSAVEAEVATIRAERGLPHEQFEQDGSGI